MRSKGTRPGVGVEYVNLRNRNGRDKYMPVDCIVINEARNNINALVCNIYIYTCISGYFQLREYRV